jgi:multidrug resistance efflux pump
VDQPVQISVNSFPGQVFGGRVIRIADSAEFTPRNVATQDERQNLVFAVEIRVFNETGQLKPGCRRTWCLKGVSKVMGNWKLETGNWKLEMGNETWGPAARALRLTPYALLLLASCLLFLSGCATATALTQEETVLTASGTIRAPELRVASEFGGRVQTIPVQLGDTVQAGDVLVTLDATPWLLQLSPAEAAVEVAKADLAALRARPLPAEIEAARNALALAEVQRDNARVAWENAQALVETPQEIDAQIVQARAQVGAGRAGVELAERYWPPTIAARPDPGEFGAAHCGQPSGQVV